MSKKFLKLLLSFSLIAVLSLIVVWGVRADDEGTVTATVTVQNISVTVTDGTVAYGTLGQNSTADTEPAQGQTATNNGNVTEDFDIKGLDSADWTLETAAGTDQYVHKFCNDTDNDCTTPPTSYTALTTDYQDLDSAIITSGTVLFQLQINTPNPSTVYTEQSVNVTVLATAAS